MSGKEATKEKSNLEMFEDGDKSLKYLLNTSFDHIQNWKEQYAIEKKEMDELYDKFQKKWNARCEMLANVFEPTEK